MEVTSDGTHVLCPAINSAVLKCFSQRINRCRMSIVDNGDVAMEMMGKASSGNAAGGEAEVTKELIYISSDGVKIQVYQNSEGVHCFSGVPLSGTYKEHFYPNLPPRLWKKYLHAYKFVEVVKSKTPRVVVVTDRAKCKLMENVPMPDFEAHFHDGLRILLSKGKIHVTEASGGTMTLNAENLNSRVTERTMHLIEYAIMCQAECHRIHESLMAIQARDDLINVFPVTIGTIHNPFFISQQTSCESNDHDPISLQASSDLNHVVENSTVQMQPMASVLSSQYLNSEVPVSSFSDLNNSLAPCNAPLHQRENGAQLNALQATQVTDFVSSCCCCPNTESQAGSNVPLVHASPCKGASHQRLCEAKSAQLSSDSWAHSPVKQGQFQNPLFESDSSCGITGNANSHSLSNFSQSSKSNIINQESFGLPITELDIPKQSSSTSVPFSISCYSENMTPCQPLCLPGENFTTPTAKCQSTNISDLKQCHSDGCMRMKSHTKENSQDIKNTFQTQDVKRNLFGENVIQDNTEAGNPPQKFPPSAAYPDLLDKCYTENNRNLGMAAVENSQINAYHACQHQFPPQQHQDMLSTVNNFHEEVHYQQPFNDSSSSCSDKNEMKQIIDKLKSFHTFSNTCSADGADISMNPPNSNPSPNVLSGQCATSTSPQVVWSHAYPSHELSTVPSTLDVVSLHINDMPLQPLHSQSPKKLSRKVATSSGSSVNSKSESLDLATIDENQQTSMKSDRSFPCNDSTRGSLSELSSGSDSGSFNKHNTSLPNSFGVRKSINSKPHSDKFNCTFSHCASPSHSRVMANFPMSPQKEFLQGGGRESQSLDNTLPPQVRNSLDMSVSSYYSDSPSSSPSSGCDPIYQVFVPYTGWASYYAGGAIWLLYNDGTQLGVKATEAVMTFIDQDGTQKKYQNGDVVPEIVKMKLEKMPNVLKTVMKNKDVGNTSS